MARPIDGGPVLEEGDRRVVGPATVFCAGGEHLAVESRCPHMGYPMREGTVRDGVVTCAWHRWEFDLQTGGCYRGGSDDLRVFPVRIVDGRIQVDVEAAAPERARYARRLGDAMLEADEYLQAKATAQLLGAGAMLVEVAEVAAVQAFRHAIAAHQSEVACFELQAIVDAARLARPLADPVPALLHGIRTGGGPSGHRPEVEPLPGPPLDAERVASLLLRYTDDPSPLAIERVLCSTAIPEEALGPILLDVSTRPWFVPLPSVLRSVASTLDATRWLGTEEARRRRAALLAWTLGRDRPTLEADEREAVEWCSRHRDRLGDLGDGDGEADLDRILAADGVTGVLDGLLDALEGGASAARLLDALSLRFARRFARLWLDNGGLWGTATEGLRLVHDLRRALPVPGGPLLVHGLTVLAVHAWRSRWLQEGRPWERPQTADGGWDDLRRAFEAMDRKQAQALLLGLAERDPDDVERGLVEILLREDQQVAQLHTLRAVLDEWRRHEERAPFLAGMLTYALDRRRTREVAAAARFGRTFAGGGGGPGGP